MLVRVPVRGMQGPLEKQRPKAAARLSVEALDSLLVLDSPFVSLSERVR